NGDRQMASSSQLVTMDVEKNAKHPGTDCTGRTPQAAFADRALQTILDEIVSTIGIVCQRARISPERRHAPFDLVHDLRHRLLFGNVPNSTNPVSGHIPRLLVILPEVKGLAIIGPLLAAVLACDLREFSF